MPWLIKCSECSNVRKLLIGYDISDMKKIYVYCPKCMKNTFHEIIKYVDD